MGHKLCIEEIFDSSHPHRKRTLSFLKMTYIFMDIDRSRLALFAENRNR